MIWHQYTILSLWFSDFLFKIIIHLWLWHPYRFRIASSLCIYKYLSISSSVCLSSHLRDSGRHETSFNHRRHETHHQIQTTNQTHPTTTSEYTSHDQPRILETNTPNNTCTKFCPSFEWCCHHNQPCHDHRIHNIHNMHFDCRRVWWPCWSHNWLVVPQNHALSIMMVLVLY